MVSCRREYISRSQSRNSVAGADNYDGDTHADILLRSSASGDVGMWLMNGATIIGGSLVGPLALGYEIR
jgi:hypothetical protein